MAARLLLVHTIAAISFEVHAIDEKALWLIPSALMAGLEAGFGLQDIAPRRWSFIRTSGHKQWKDRSSVL
eukprot:IDg10132t1